MRDKTVYCSMSGCENAADVKIAAPWKEGRFAELKTYGYACHACAPEALELAKKRANKPLHLSEGETVGEIAEYEVFKG
jgi:hypothetical protein